MANRYTIDSLEIEGFRGYLDEMTHSLHSDSTVIFGSQGSGKSSTLNAIEWCLFGKIAYFKSAESKSDAEIVNARAGGREAKVKIKLVSESSQAEIIRTKKINTRETNVLVNVDGMKEEGGAAQELIFKLLGITFDDFYRSVYLHQESINALITDDPRKRDEAIDRLLGLERVRNIIGSIPMQNIKKSLAELTSQKEKISTKLQGAIEQITAQVKKAENEASKEGITNEQITIIEISNLLAKLQTDLGEIAKESQSEPMSIPSELNVDVVAKLIPRMKNFLRNCRKKVVEVSGADDLRSKQGDMKELEMKSSKLLKDKIEKERYIKEIEDAFGNVDVIANKINETNSRIEQLNKDRDELDARAKLAKDALYFFETPDISDCPVCGQAITSETVKSHLEEMVDSTTGRQIDEIYRQISESKELVKALTDREDNLKGLRQDLADVLNKISESESKCSEVAGKKISIDKMSEFLNGYIGSLQDKINDSNNAFRIKNDHIETAENEIDRIQLINNVLQKREDYGAVETKSMEENEENRGLSQSILEIEKFKGNIEVLVQTLNEIQNTSATESISQAQDKMGSIYSRLMAHPYYNQLDISVTSKNVQGIQKNTYLVKARSEEEQRDTYVSSRFSSGQLNCTALAIFLSLAEISQNKLGFILLDDPSQSLDLQHVNSLSEVLSDFSKSRQVLISTQEDNLYDSIKNAFVNNGSYKELKFKPWTKNGCQLENL